MSQCFLYQCLTFKSNFKILNETQTEYWSDEGPMMKVATRFERRQNKAKNDKVVLYKLTKYKCTMHIKLLNALNKLFQLGNIA